MKYILLPILRFIFYIFFYLVVVPLAIIVLFIIGLWNLKFENLKSFLVLFFKKDSLKKYFNDEKIAEILFITIIISFLLTLLAGVISEQNSKIHF